MPYLDAFRLRWWSKPVPKPGPPSDNDSLRSSSSERVGRRISLRLTPPTKARRSAVPARNLHHASEKLLPATRLFHHESLNEKSDTHPFEQPTDELLKLSGSATIVHKSSLPAMKSSLVRRVTSKLRITVPTNVASSQTVSSTAYSSGGAERSSRPSQRNSLYQSHTLADDFLSRERREAALRERGLRPPRKDLSEQEREADQRLTLVPLPVSEQGEISAASKIKEEWLLMNLSTEIRTSDPSSTFSEQSGVAASSHPASESLPWGLTCDSDCTHPNLPLISRSSISSSVLPQSQPYLEVLEEEPVEHVPSPLRVQLPIVISTPVADSFPPGSPVLIESPISCSSSSHLVPPESFSQQHPPLPTSPDKENSYSQFPMPPARRRATNSSNRSRSSVGNSLSKFGTDSFTNLRRSVIGSIRHSGSSADLSTSSAQPSSPRMAVSPTIHNRESIMFETKGIKDAESRRLSELAFLD